MSSPPAHKKPQKPNIPVNPWENAHEVTLPNNIGILQIVGICSPTHTAFGRIIGRECDQVATVINAVQWMIEEIQLCLNSDVNTSSEDEDLNNNMPITMSAKDLLRLGCAWILRPSSGAKNQNDRLKRTRIFWQQASLEMSEDDAIRLHFLPNRFPATFSARWKLPSIASNNTPVINNKDSEIHPSAIVHCDLQTGFVVVNKPSAVPSHATVDNGVENVLYQLERANSDVIISKGPSLPQRLDTETSGLLLVAFRSEFASYIGRLLQKKSTISSSTTTNSSGSNAITKQYRCLVHVDDIDNRDNLIRRTEQDNGVVTHYMDPSSTAPKTFVAATDQPNGWLKCVLRVLEIGPCRYFTTATSSNTSSNANAAKTNQSVPQRVMEIKVELLTGRTHQIRGQLAALNLPLVGDPLYRGTATQEQPKSSLSWHQARNRTESCGTVVVEPSKMGLQCCCLRFPEPQWITTENNKKGKQMLVETKESREWAWELSTAWWTSKLLE